MASGGCLELIVMEVKTMRAKTICFLVLAGVLTIFWPGRAFSQQVSGTITGYVTDPSGAPIPGASVTATNLLTGVATNRATEPSGLYLITNLIPGTYSVAIEAKGFQHFVQENIVLSVDSKVTVDAHMVLGAVTQQLTVSSAPPMLKTEKADVSQILPERTIESLPTVGRNVTRLHLLMPGTQAFIFQQPAGENPSLGATVVANGQFWGSNEYMIDGITDVEFGSTGMQIVNPNADSVQEMKVTTADYDAELGQVSGLVAQYVTKNGTNDLHGSLFWFNRNKRFFAADPFAEKVPGTGPHGKGTGPAPFNWNQFGGSLGGPIKKNRMFIFGDYQANRTRQGASLLATVPPQDFQSGDLTRALGAVLCFDPANPSSNGVCGGVLSSPLMVPTTEGGTIQAQQNMVFDPTTGNPDGSGRSAFTVGGVPNMIPPARFNPVSVNLLNLLNQGVSGKFIDQTKTSFNFPASGSQLFDQDQFDVRYDVNLSEKDKAFVRYTYFTALLNNPALFGPADGPAVGGLSPESAKYRNHLGAINYTHTFSPSLLAEARVGIVRFGLRGLQADVGHNTDDAVGIKGINGGDPLTQGLAGITVAGPVGNWFMGIPTGVGIPRIQFNTVFQWVNNWTKMYSSHQMRWGVDIRRQRFDFLSLNESSRGDFQFGQTITGDSGMGGTGLGMATFLLGLPSYYDRAFFSQFPAERNTRFAWYWQDDWHVNPKLTFNYGLRYEYIGPSTPHFAGGGVNYDPNTGNLLLSGLGSVSRSGNVKPDRNNFGPRLGFAYKVLSKTVVRGGFGVSYFGSNYGAVMGTLCCSYPIQTPQNIPQFNSYFPIRNPVTGGLYSIDQTVPPPPPLAFPSSGLLPLPPGTRPLAVPFDTRTSYIETWNLTAQHQLTQNLTLSVAYVGNAGRKLYSNIDINAPYPGPGDVDLRRPYHFKPGVDVQVTDRCHCTNSNYNALQVTAEKRFGLGYSFLSSYTWSKALDNEFGGFEWGGQSINPHNVRSAYGISGYNRASVWTLGHVWHLPYGTGQHWGSSAPAWKKGILGGWVFNGFTTVGGGWPVGISWSDGSSLNVGGAFGQRPDLVGDPTKNIPPGLWYNPAAFANPKPYNFGNYGRNGGDLRGPGYSSADWAVWKEFYFKTPLAREETTLQFRWESFNLFNRTNLAQPDNTADSSTAGRIFGILGNGVYMRRMQFGLRLVW